MASPVKSMSNGTSSHPSDKHAALDYLKSHLHGEQAERPEITDKHILEELKWADFAYQQAEGNLDTLKFIYEGLAAFKKGEKPQHPLFAELMAEEEEQAPAGILYSEIERRDIRWLWKGRLAFGKLTVFDGDPGEGKSSILCDLAARYSRGRPMPGEEWALAPAGGVVLVMIEDDPADTIIHRLERAGADLNRISHLAEIPAGEISGIPITRDFSLLTDIGLLIREIKRMNAKFVVLDPLAGLIGKTDTNSSTAMYAALAPIASVARALDVSVVFTRHLNKQQAENSLYRGAGTMGIIGRTRFGLIVGRDPENESISVLANHKNNPVKKVASLSYQITSDDERGDYRSYVNWLGVNKHSSKELFTGGGTMTLGMTSQVIMALMEATGMPMQPVEIWQALKAEHPDLTPENVRQHLSRLKKEGYVTTHDYGKYILQVSLSDVVTPVTPVTPPSQLALEADTEGVTEL